MTDQDNRPLRDALTPEHKQHFLRQVTLRHWLGIAVVAIVVLVLIFE